MTIPFWINEPTILFNHEYISELWPSNNMCYNRKLNAITRLVILLTILGYISTHSYKIVLVGLLTIIGIYFVYKSNKDKLTSKIISEGFTDGENEYGNENKDENKDENKKKKNRNKNKNVRFNNLVEETTIINPETLGSFLKSEFKEGSKKNPFSNVLLTDIMDEPNRKPAPPSFNVDVDESITKNVKRAVQRMNPGIENTSHQLYGSLWDNFELDQSNRVFYTTANSRVENDQSAFAQYLYNDLKYSAKESTPEGNFARLQDNLRYLNY
jgi:hypothetical protein